MLTTDYVILLSKSMNNFNRGEIMDALDEAAKQTMLEIRRNCMVEVDALLAAGWKYELPEIVNRKEGDPPSSLDSEPWQWYWRRPPRRKGSKGMKFWSTSMAFNALKREGKTNVR